MYQHIRILLSLSFMFALVMVVGCASPAAKDTCPTISQEPVSACRAETLCKQKRNSSNFGLAPSNPGSDFALGAGETQSSDNYARCIDRDMADQKAQQQIK